MSANCELLQLQSALLLYTRMWKPYANAIIITQCTQKNAGKTGSTVRLSNLPPHLTLYIYAPSPSPLPLPPPLLAGPAAGAPDAPDDPQDAQAAFSSAPPRAVGETEGLRHSAS